MLVIIVVAICIVWIPFYVMYCIGVFTIGKIPCSYYWFCLNIPLLYPVVNPVVYYIFNAKYRQGFRELLCFPWPCANKCNGCIRSSTSPQGGNNVENYAGQVNNAMENIELQEHR